MQALRWTNVVMGEATIENQGAWDCRGKQADDWDWKQNFTFRGFLVCLSCHLGHRMVDEMDLFVLWAFKSLWWDSSAYRTLGILLNISLWSFLSFSRRYWGELDMVCVEERSCQHLLFLRHTCLFESKAMCQSAWEWVSLDLSSVRTITGPHVLFPRISQRIAQSGWAHLQLSTGGPWFKGIRENGKTKWLF